MVVANKETIIRIIINNNFTITELRHGLAVVNEVNERGPAIMAEELAA